MDAKKIKTITWGPRLDVDLRPGTQPTTPQFTWYGTRIPRAVGGGSPRRVFGLVVWRDLPCFAFVVDVLRRRGGSSACSVVLII